jgi:hypothetical protein
MNNDNQININLIEYIKFYLTLKNPQFTILINGKWGSGKTFFIKKQIDKWSSNEKTDYNIPTKRKTSFSKEIDSKIEGESNETINLKPIYVSLYGVSSASEINQKIKEALNPLFYSKGAKIAKNILFGALKTATYINFDIDGDGKSDGKVSFDINSLGLLKGTDEKVKGEKLIVFDDLERSKLKISELFGYINEFVEHYNCKVILLSDEERMKERCKSEEDAYNDFKEKLIGQTFTIQPDIVNAIDVFINKTSKSSERDFLISSKDLIKSVFIASKIENLRILRQSILDFERFVKQFNNDFTKHEKYNEFLKSLIGHFILVYLEFKSGNVNISNISKYSYTEDEKKEEQKIRSKYNEVLNKFNIYDRMSVIHYEFVVDFINNGYSNTIELTNAIKDNGFFRDTEPKDWEKLWSWEILEEDEFEKLYNSVLNSLKNKELENPYVLLHIITIIISLKRNNIISSIDFDLVAIFKEQFDIILDKNKNTPFSRFSDHSWGKGYRENDSEEFKLIVSYANDKILIHNSQNKEDYLKQVFETLNNENILQLQEKLDVPLPDRSSNYSLVPILLTVNGNKLAESLLKLTNKNLDSFFYFLNRRYYPEEVYSNGHLATFNAQDKKCLIDLKNRLELEVETLPKLKKYNLTNHISFLNKLILKLDKLEEKTTNANKGS